MVHAGIFLVVCLVRAVLAHRGAHAAESVRLLRANETVHASGSDLVFSWEKCVICDGYDARLLLQDISGTRVIPHTLKSAVTSLKITSLPPRTVYKLVVKRLPADAVSSTVSGRTFSPDAPLPVDNLVARVLTDTSIQIEWTSKNADGFIARILENNTTIQEKVIPDFSNHSIVNITNLKPETEYRVEVTAFYFPPGGNSISTVSSARVKTLPAVLPNLHLTWNFDSELELSWKNPVWPSPLMHKLRCAAGPGTLLTARFGGNTGFVAVPDASYSAEIDCVLETWFSVDRTTAVKSLVTALKPAKRANTESTSPDSGYCPRSGSYSIETSVDHKVEPINGMELLVLTFTKPELNAIRFNEAQFKLCELDGSCDDRWISVPHADYPKLLLQQGDLKAWTPYRVQTRFVFRCSYNNDPIYTKARSFVVPPLIGPVFPVTDITATTSLVSWKYNDSAPSPNYFLVTYCTGRDCSSQSVSGDKRSVSLGQLKGSSVYYVTIQAVQLRDDRAYISPTEMTSIVSPEDGANGNVTLTFTEVANSSTVTLLIVQNSSADHPPVVEYHIDVCKKTVSRWNDAALAGLLSSNRSCESMVSTNSSIDLERLPWTAYDVSVIVCYGAFDSEHPVNLTLPIYKRNPSPLTGLSWSESDSRLSWRYDFQIPSGFSISICPSRDDAPDMCSDIVAGPLDRQYHVDSRDLIESGFIVFVTPFVTYEGQVFNGTRFELPVNGSGSYR